MVDGQLVSPDGPRLTRSLLRQVVSARLLALLLLPLGGSGDVRQVLVDQALPLLSHGHSDVLLLVIPAQFEQSKHGKPTPRGPGEPHTKLSSEHLHVETFRIHPINLIYIILGSISAPLEPPGHFPAPCVEAESDEEGGGQCHRAHQNGGDDIDEGREETAVLALVDECGGTVGLGGREDEHDDTHKDGEVAVSLTGPGWDELAIVFTPLTSSKEKTVTLKVLLVHGHGNGDAERENCCYAVTRELDVQNDVGAGWASHCSSAHSKCNLIFQVDVPPPGYSMLGRLLNMMGN